jgi:two-component system OmpR family sensor kinase
VRVTDSPPSGTVGGPPAARPPGRRRAFRADWPPTARPDPIGQIRRAVAARLSRLRLTGRWAAAWRRWQPPIGWIDLAWIVIWVVGLAGIVFGHWETIPFHLIWLGFALIYSFRIRSTKPTIWVLAAMLSTTLAAIGLDMLRGLRPTDELTEVPLMAAVFWIMMLYGRRRLAANAEREAVSEENERLLTTQSRFLQDASHQLRTPITIALGHSELLARHLADNQDKRDINVIIGELNRLRTLSDRLLLIAASENPDFLEPQDILLDQLIAEAADRWRPAADRRWQLGRLDPAAVHADRERLQQAVDALLENAVQHTGPGDRIRLSVLTGADSRCARIAVEDSGSGIAPEDLSGIFERFATGSGSASRRGTGLGLALVRAVARGHGGEIAVRSALGVGSTFELVLPILSAATQLPSLAAPARTGPASHPGGRHGRKWAVPRPRWPERAFGGSQVDSRAAAAAPGNQDGG